MGNLRPDAKEKILKCQMYPLEEVMQMLQTYQLFCGFTKSIILDFLVSQNLIKFA